MARFADDPARAYDDAGFRQWHDAAPDYRTAFAELEQFDAFMAASADSPQLSALRAEALDTLDATRKRRGRVRALAASLLVLVACGGGAALVAPNFMPDRAGEVVAERYATGAHEQSTITLLDGSQVTLDVSSEIRVSFTQNERRIFLDSGHAYFSVAKDRQVPFVVQARDRDITALGTTFDVWDGTDQLRVVLIEGRVEVAPATRQNVITMAPGDVLVQRGGRTMLDNIDNPASFASWRKGLLIFDDSRLADAVAEINRYTHRPIRLSDEELGELRISGAFHIRKANTFSEAMQEYFDLDDVSPAIEEVVLSRAKGRRDRPASRPGPQQPEGAGLRRAYPALR